MCICLCCPVQLKGCPSGRVNQEVDAMIKEVGLDTKRNAAAKTLSGGQKRKLSVGIALINGSKVGHDDYG